MKFDYELIKKIGATLYNKSTDVYYKYDECGYLYVYSKKYCEWRRSILKECTAKEDLAPIPLEPQLHVEYEKVNFSSVGNCVQTVYDNNGNYFYFDKRDGEYKTVEYQDAAWYWKEDNIYLRIERPVEYERVNGRIFGLEQDFDSGTLYFMDKECGEYHQIKAIKVLGLHSHNGNVYRRIVPTANCDKE